MDLDFGKFGNCLEGRLYAIRKDQKLSQEVFGNKIGVTRSAICNYESGTRPINNQIILAVCRVFSVNELWFRNGVGEPYECERNGILEQFIKNYNCSKFEGDFLKAYFQMNSEERQGFITCIYRLFAPLMKGLEGTNPFADYFNATYGIDSDEASNVESMNDPANGEDAETSELEERYIKSRSGSASKTTLSASSIIEENEKKKNA